MLTCLESAERCAQQCVCAIHRRSLAVHQGYTTALRQGSLSTRQDIKRKPAFSLGVTYLALTAADVLATQKAALLVMVSK